MKSGDVLLKVENLTKIYTSGLIRTTSVIGAKNVSFNVRKGEIITLVGESGSGKSTTANMILRLLEPTSGHIFLNGKDAFSYDKREYYKKVQVIFQDPYSSFNIFYRIDRSLNKAFDLHDEHLPPDEREEILKSILLSIGLNPDEVLGRFPHQLSGGQMQRILIARVLIIGPELLIADEPTSMIDASSRAGILNLLLDLQGKKNLSVIFITHDIAQAQYISDRVVVMKKGEVVEKGSCEKVFSNPTHPYTKELLASVPSLYEKWEF